MTWVKICGNTSLDDVRLAIELGADAVGFVFAESRRRVTPAQVATITSHLPTGIERVGVVQSRNAEEIVGIVDEAGLNTVQLHGGVDLELLHELHRRLDTKADLIQVLHWVVGADSRVELAANLRQIADEGIIDRVMIDSHVGAATGGTGVAFDWKAVRAILDETRDRLKIIVAGGLRPDNVSEAIQQLRPWGVDVVSGVESSPGHKDPVKLSAFLSTVRKAT